MFIMIGLDLRNQAIPTITIPSYTSLYPPPHTHTHTTHIAHQWVDKLNLTFEKQISQIILSVKLCFFFTRCVIE